MEGGIHMMSLVLGLSVVTVMMVCGVRGEGCCSPEHYFGPVRVLFTTVGPGMPDTSVKLYQTAYDATHQRVAIGYQDMVDNKTKFVRNILDYGKGLGYTVIGDYWYGPPDAKCSKYPLPDTWKQGACVPNNATKSEGFYMGHPAGQYYRQLDAFTYTYTKDFVTAKVMVTADACAPVGEVVYDTSDPAGTKVINRLYVNQTTYNNEDFFKLPNVTCVPDPAPPKMSAWQRMGLFGWLLAMPED